MEEGYAEYHVPGIDKPIKTWYGVVGDLKENTPLLVVHGGPGMSHDYLLPLEGLWHLHKRPVIFFDQIGSGRSTHLQEKASEPEFWTLDLFCDQILSLLKHLDVSEYDYLGQSWGGMLGAIFASKRPAGLRKLIISNSPASMPKWLVACDKLRNALPKDVQDCLLKHEADGTTETDEYEAAVNVFYERHLCRKLPFPEPLLKTFEWLKKDPTVYHVMNGPSEFFVVGTLKTFSAEDDVRKIQAPTLLVNGRYDEAQDSCVEPFFRNIDKVKWVTMDQSSHLPMLEETDRYLEIVQGFLEA